MPEVSLPISPDDLASCESTELRWIDTTSAIWPSAIWLGSAQIVTTSSSSHPAMKFYKPEGFFNPERKAPVLSERIRELRGILLAQRHQKATALAQWKSESPLRTAPKYVRSVSTRAQWLQLQQDLMVVGFRYKLIRILEKLRGEFSELGSRTWRGSRLLPYGLDVAVPIAEDDLNLVDPGLRITTRFVRAGYSVPLRVYFNPLHEADPEHESRYLVCFEGSNYRGPSIDSLRAGAVAYCMNGSRTPKWYVSEDAMQKEVQAQTVKALINGELVADFTATKAELENCIIKKDLSGQPVYVFGLNHRRDYHSAPNYREDRYSNLDPSAKRTVGVELEFNSGRTTSVERAEIIQDWLIAMDGKGVIERDGSVSAFELITGHGKPSSLRQLLAPVFRDPRIKHLAIGAGTGAHVHVSASEDEKTLLAGTSGRHLHGLLRGVYHSLANRRNNRYAREASRPDYDRYSEISISNDLPTLELRLFKADRQLPRIIRNTQFANSYMEFLAHWGMDIHDKTLEDFWSLVADQPREETIELRTWAVGHGYKVPNRRGELRNLYKELGFARSLVN